MMPMSRRLTLSKKTAVLPERLQVIPKLLWGTLHDQPPLVSSALDTNVAYGVRRSGGIDLANARVEGGGLNGT
jgi:hypothetical protein